MALALDVLKQRSTEAVWLRAEQKAARGAAAEAQAVALRDMADRVEHEARASVTTIRGSVASLNEAAEAMLGHSERSTDEIARHIEAVGSATEGAMTAVRSPLGTMAEPDATVGSIADAMAQQNEATEEIARNVTNTANAARNMAGRLGEVVSQSEQVGQQANTVRNTAEGIGHDVDRLRQALVEAARTSTDDVDRGGEQRRLLRLRATMKHDGQVHGVWLDDISIGGTGLSDAPALRQGLEVSLSVPGLTREVAAEVMDSEAGRLRLRFLREALAEAQLKGVLAIAA